MYSLFLGKRTLFWACAWEQVSDSPLLVRPPLPTTTTRGSSEHINVHRPTETQARQGKEHGRAKEQSLEIAVMEISKTEFL